MRMYSIEIENRRSLRYMILSCTMSALCGCTPDMPIWIGDSDSLALGVFVEARIRVALEVEGESEIDALVSLERPTGLTPLREKDWSSAIIDASNAAIACADVEQDRVVRIYQHVPIVRLRLDQATLERITMCPGVRAVGIEPPPMHPYLAESVPLVNADAARRAGYTGAGTSVAVIDTYVDSSNSFLSGRVVVSEGSGTCGTHGTMTAAIAAGGCGSSYCGVAPSASILAFNMGGGEDCRILNYIDALDSVVTYASTYNIAAVNMSFGSGPEEGEVYTDETSCVAAGGTAARTALETVYLANVLPVAATGNDGNSTGVNSPACLPKAMAVVASWDESFPGTTNFTNCSDENPARDDLACFSNGSSALVDIAAPGAMIASAGFAPSAGTSVAAPHVAGVAALVRQAHPTWTALCMEQAIRSTTHFVSDSRNGATYPRLDATDAINASPSGVDEHCFDDDGTLNGTDEDCSGAASDNAVDAPSWYLDTDGDFYGDDNSVVRSCTQPSGHVSIPGDCDDLDPYTYPGAAEAESESACMTDADLDGFGTASPRGGITAGTDCNDANDEVYPGAQEGCNGIDNDCSGAVAAWEEDTYYEDHVFFMDCEDMDHDGSSFYDGDCNPWDNLVYPGAAERCNGQDDACVGSLADDEADYDQDGWMACEGDCVDTDSFTFPYAQELRNGYDANCVEGDEQGMISGCGACSITDRGHPSDTVVWLVLGWTAVGLLRRRRGL